MSRFTLICSAAALAAFSFAAHAEDSMGSEAMKGESDMMMVPKGQTVVVMPDGAMSMMATPEAMMSPDAMKMMKPMDHCVMMTMGADGKMMMMDDMKMADGKMACDAMKSMMTPSK